MGNVIPVAVFPMGFSQKRFIEKLRAEGEFRIIGFDGNNRAHCRELADEFFGFDDERMILQILKELNCSHIFSTQSDIGQKVASCVAEELGNFHVPCLVARQVRLKHIVRRRVALTAPEFNPRFFIELFENNWRRTVNVLAINFFNNHLKIVVKPSDNQGSRGVEILDSAQFVSLEAFERRISQSVENAFLFSRQKVVLVESFESGDEITIEGFVLNDEFTILATSKKQHSARNKAVAIGLDYYDFLTESQKKEVKEFIEKVLKLPEADIAERYPKADFISKWEVPYALVHLEFKLGKPDGNFPRAKTSLKLIDFALRGGGHFIASDIVPQVCRFDYEMAQVWYLLDRKRFEMEVKKVFPFGKCAALRFFDFEPGVVKRVLVEPTVEKLCYMWGLNFSRGDELKVVEDDTKRHGYFIVFASDYDELSNKIDEVYNSVKIEYE